MRKHRAAHPLLDSIAFAGELLIVSAIAAAVASLVAAGGMIAIAHATGVI